MSLILALVSLALMCRVEAISVDSYPCPVNKVAPHQRAAPRTFLQLFSSFSQGQRPSRPSFDSQYDDSDESDCDDSSVQDAQDYEQDYYYPERPIRPHRPPRPERPHRPSIWDHFNGYIPPQNNPTRPPRPTRPPYYTTTYRPSRPPLKPVRPTRPTPGLKPVHEIDEEDTSGEIWRPHPNGIVGGINGDIIGQQQDFSKWNRTRTTQAPRRNYNIGRPPIISSFIDLFIN